VVTVSNLMYVKRPAVPQHVGLGLGLRLGGVAGKYWIVLPDAENQTIVSSFVWTQYRNVTE